MDRFSLQILSVAMDSDQKFLRNAGEKARTIPCPGRLVCGRRWKGHSSGTGDFSFRLTVANKQLLHTCFTMTSMTQLPGKFRCQKHLMQSVSADYHLLVATGAFAETVHTNDSGTNLIHSISFSPINPSEKNTSYC